MNAKRLFPVAAVAISFASVLAGCATYDGEPEVIRVHAMLVLDPRDPEELVEFSDEVFVGRVVAEERTDYEQDDMPATVYSVEVLEPIKNSPSGTTEVSLDGGISKDGKHLYLMEGAKLLTDGEEYLFAGRRDEKGLLDLVSVGGSEPIDLGTPHANETVEALTYAQASARTDTPNSDKLRSEPSD